VQEEGKADFESAFGYYIFRLPEKYLTLAEILSAEGYRTGGIIGGPFTSAIFGLGQGFDYYDEDFLGVDKDINSSLIYQIVDLLIPLKDFVVQHGYSDTKRLASDLNKAAFRWLEKNREQPFFLFMNYFDPHNPYLPPPPYDEYFGKVESSVIVKPNPERDKNIRTAESTLILSVLNGNHQLTDEEKAFLVSLYDGEIRYLDNCVGQLFARLKALGVYDNTLIIVTSDHGEAFGEHKQVDHGRTLYDVLLRVPLLIKYSSSNPQRGTVAKRVSLVDLMPTILSFLGYPIPAGIDGHPLSDSERPIIAEWHPKWFEIEKYRRDLRAVYQGGKKYIWASNSLHELYDLEKDPQEEKNLIAKFHQRAEAMEKILQQWLSSFKPPNTEKEAVKINKSTEERLRALGYVR
jgi:arylsulfatase A-like enzyme